MITRIPFESHFLNVHIFRQLLIHASGSLPYCCHNRVSGLLFLDSKAPSSDYKEFILGEVRYSSLQRANPERAEKLFAKAEQNAKNRLDYLEKLKVLYGKKD